MLIAGGEVGREEGLDEGSCSSYARDELLDLDVQLENPYTIQ